MSPEQVEDGLKVLDGWQADSSAAAISKQFLMKDFMEALKFIRRIGEIAEAEDHHPDLHLTSYRKLTIELSTHSIGGLSDNDFILAAKIDALPKSLKN